MNNINLLLNPLHLNLTLICSFDQNFYHKMAHSYLNIEAVRAAVVTLDHLWSEAATSSRATNTLEL